MKKRIFFAMVIVFFSPVVTYAMVKSHNGDNNARLFDKDYRAFLDGLWEKNQLEPIFADLEELADCCNQQPVTEQLNLSERLNNEQYALITLYCSMANNFEMTKNELAAHYIVWREQKKAIESNTIICWQGVQKVE